jgi:hypothetical protein
MRKRLFTLGTAGASLIVLLVASYSVLRVLDRALAEMHPAGHPSITATGMASPRTLLSADAIAEAAQSWNDWSVEHQGGGLEHHGVLWRYFFVDIFGIAAPLSLLLLVGWYRANESVKKDLHVGAATGGEHRRLVGIRNILAATPVAIGAYFVADLLEDGLLLAAGWKGGSRLTVFCLGLASLVKWLLLAAAVVPLALAVLGTRATRSRARAAVATARVLHRPHITALRGQLLVAMLLFVVLLLPGDLGRQVDDAVLLLTDRGELGLAVWTALTALALSVLVYLTGCWCLAAYGAEPTPNDGRFRKWVPRLSVLAVALVVVGFAAFTWRWVFGVSVLVPGLLLGGFLLLSLKRFTAPDEAPKPLSPNPGKLSPNLGDPSDDSPAPTPITEEQAPQGDYLWVLRTLSIAPLLVLGVVAVRGSFALEILGARAPAIALLALGILAVVVCSAWIALGPATMPSNSWPSRRRAIVVIAAAGIGIMVAGAILALPLGRWGGPWTMLLLFQAAILLTVTALVLAGNRVPAYGVFAVVGLRRTPFIAILLVCFLGSSLVNDRWGYHDARLLDDVPLAQPSAQGGEPNRRALALESALGDWADSSYVSERAKQVGSTGAPIPIVFIAAAGGGIRAAYWTTAVLHCLFGDRAWKPPAGTATADAFDCSTRALPDGASFLASGISGSSLGLALTLGGGEDQTDYREALTADFLGPELAAFAFRDTPNSLLRIGTPGYDRAAVLEQAWEQAAAAHHGDLTRGFAISAWDGKRPRFPLLALNGTSIADGCRLTVSVLDLASPRGNPLSGSGRPTDDVEAGCLSIDDISHPAGARPALAGTKDAFDRTCPSRNRSDQTPRDLRLSTAALLSARFPYVSPSGSLTSCLDPDHRTFDLDGGLIDSSAAGPIALLWPQVLSWLADRQHTGGRCFAPKLLLIDNGYVSRTQAKPAQRPQELTAPRAAMSAVSNSRTAAARQAAALAFQRAFPTPACARPAGQQNSNVAHFYPLAHPGVQAPLGWTLSRWSREDLDHQLANRHNACQVKIVRSWFTQQYNPVNCPDDAN